MRLSAQVCLEPKDFLNDWWESEESDNDSETIDDRDIKERSLEDYDFISLYPFYKVVDAGVNKKKRNLCK